MSKKTCEQLLHDLKKINHRIDVVKTCLRVLGDVPDYWPPLSEDIEELIYRAYLLGGNDETAKG
jgi:hypothetical protein